MRIQATRLVAAIVCAVAFPIVTLAADGYSLFGGATLTSPGAGSPTAVQLSSAEPPAAPLYSGIDFDIPAGLTFSGLFNLATDYMFTQGSCGGGSPRFQVNLSDGTTTGNVFVYLGPPPNYNNCAANTWLNTGNLVTPASLVDTGQLPGGGPYDVYAAAQGRYGSYAVTGIQLVADSGWMAAQTVLVDNVEINTATFTFEGVETCKKDGWRLFVDDPGPFRNQGQCVSYFSRNR